VNSNTILTQSTVFNLGNILAAMFRQMEHRLERWLQLDLGVS